MKLSGSEDVVHCGDKERRNDDHAFRLEAAETGETPAKIEAMLHLCPPPSRAMKNPSALQHITVWSFCSCAVWTEGDGQGNYYEQTEAGWILLTLKKKKKRSTIVHILNVAVSFIY